MFFDNADANSVSVLMVFWRCLIVQHTCTSGLLKDVFITVRDMHRLVGSWS